MMCECRVVDGLIYANHWCPVHVCRREVCFLCQRRRSLELPRPWFTRLLRVGRRTAWEWRCGLRYPGRGDCPGCPHLGMILRDPESAASAEGRWEFWSDIPLDLGIPYQAKTWDEAEALLLAASETEP